MAKTAARLAGGAAIAGLALSPLLFALPGRSGKPPVPKLGNALVAFEPNAGRGPAGVDYYARLGGGSVALSSDRATVRVASGKTVVTRLIGARTAAASAEQPLRLRVSDLAGSDPSRWRTGLPTFGQVRYSSVYPGVDLRYYGRGNALEYDFLVRPGARTSAIALDLGAAHTWINRKGDLIADGIVRQMRPAAWQRVGGKRVPVRAAFRLDGTRVGFRLGRYDRGKPLVIDPVLTLSDRVGGTSFENAWGVATDSAGNAYVGGSTSSTSIPGGAQNGSGPGGFLLKIAPGGVREWITYVSGQVQDVAVGPTGDPYVTGRSDGGLAVKNAAQSTFGGFIDAFVGRFNGSDGGSQWLTYWGGTGGDNGIEGSGSIAVDAAGTAYVSGDSSSTTAPGGVTLATVGAYDTTGDSGGDGFLSTYSPTGTRIATTFLGGSAGDNIWGVAVRSSCSSGCPVFVGGQTSSSNFPTSVGTYYDSTYGDGGADGFLTKMKADLTGYTWSTFYGGTGFDMVKGVAAESSSGYPTIVGMTRGSTDDAFIHQYTDPPSQSGYDDVIGGSGNDQANDIEYQSGNNFYIVGTTASSDFPTTLPVQKNAGGAGDAFAIKFNGNLTASNPILWSTYLGGGNSELGYGIAGGASGDAWVVGTTLSDDFPLVANQQPQSTSIDGFVATIGLDPVTIDSGPTGTINVRDAAFKYSASVQSPRYSCRLSPSESGFSACPSSGVSYTGLADGDYTFEVKVSDISGMTGRPTARQFTVNTRPVADLKIAPNPALVGAAVTFDASASTGAGQAIADYQWDLDGDGTFEQDTGSTPTLTTAFNSPRDNPASVRVTDAVGATAIATKQLQIKAPPPLGTQFGVTINNGAQFTKSPDVTVSANFPTTTTSMLFSNDGGFLAPSVFPPAKSVKWKLDSSGPERLPKTIYVRFLRGTTPSETFQDDIILDETPPVVSQATVAAVGASSSRVAASAAAAKRKWKLKVRARDALSGVAKLQVTSNKRKPGALLKYRTRLTVKSAKRPAWVRARDKAGNYSKWRRAK